MTPLRPPASSRRPRSKLFASSKAPSRAANDNLASHQAVSKDLRLSASEEELAEELINTFMAKILGGRG